MMDYVGQQLGNYRLIRPLGHGGFADVYLGKHVYLESQAAIKVLHTRLAKDDLEGFRVEARTVAELVHPNIVRVLEFGVEAGIPFLVMDYAPNGTLRQRHPKGSILPPASIVPYVKQVAVALQYAHDRKLIHRDVKPENMLVGRNNEILLSDFGIALIAHTSRSQSTQDVAGTVVYMAPEQIQGKPRLASDQYSLGVVVYEWLCGTRPFLGSFTEIATQHVLTPPPPLREKIPAISPAIEEVVMTTLAKDPRQRFANVQAFANAFEQACRLERPAIVVSPPNPPPLSSLPSSQSREVMTPPSQPQVVLTPSSQPGEVATTPPLPPQRPALPMQVSGTPASRVKGIPQPKKGPNTGLILGTVILLIVLVGGSFYAFVRSGFGNPSNVNNGNGSATNTTGGTTSPAVIPAVKVALVIDIGGLNDGGFNQLSHAGYEKARAQYGFPDVVIQSTVISDAEYAKNITAAAQQADMVIGVGFLMQNAMYTVATQFPNKKFALIDGCPTNPTDKSGACVSLPNVAPLFFKEQEAGCLVGAIAGQMEVDGKSKAPKLLGHNTISAVGGLAIPPVVRYIAGYKYCAQKVDPSVNVVIGYSNNFSDPTPCKALAEKQIADNSADILFQVAGGCGIGVLDAATQHNVYSIGVDVDQSKDSTGAVRPSVITSAVKRIDVAVYDIIKDTQNGNFTSNPPKFFDIAHDGVGYAPVSADVPADARATADSYAQQIMAGTLTPPESIP